MIISVSNAGEDFPENMRMKSTWWSYMKDADFIAMHVEKASHSKITATTIWKKIIEHYVPTKDIFALQ